MTGGDAVVVEPDDLDRAATDGDCVPGLADIYGGLVSMLGRVDDSGGRVNANSASIVTAAQSIFSQVERNHRGVALGLKKAAAGYRDTDEDGRRRIDRTYRQDDE